MANWSNPTLTSTYTDFLGELKNRDDDLAKQFDGTTSSNLATGTIRWNSTANRWQKWNGSAWAELTGTYALTALTTTGNASIGGTLAVTGATTLAAATATTPATGDNSTAVATTAYVRAQAYAPLASPALTGTPTVPTAAVNTNTTQAASTAFVQAEIANDAPSKTGTGASGTWGINVTGSSSSCTGNSNTASSVVNTVAGTSSVELVRGNMADNDQFRILVGGSAGNAGFAEIATADDGTEPIYVRQYNGVFSSIARTATLLDGSGNTAFPGVVEGTRLTSTVATGTAPFTVASTTRVSNLNAATTGNADTVTTNANLTGDVTSVGNATSIAAGAIVNSDINASAAIVDTKLATIATAGKVSNSATTAASANTASAIVARDASGNFSAGTITASLTGTASGNLVSGGALGTPSSGTLTNCTFPIANTTANGVISTGSQAFAGEKHFTETIYRGSTSTSPATTTARWVLNPSGEAWFARTGLAANDENVINTQRNSNGNVFRCIHGTTGVGGISITASATAYNTSSDYRLKENITPLDGAIARLNQLPVHRFNFIADPDTVVDGFIAHEAAAVVPECVTGVKDEVDEDGDPIYQGIDQSKVVPLLTAALQEAIAMIGALEPRIAALEA